MWSRLKGDEVYKYFCNYNIKGINELKIKLKKLCLNGTLCCVRSSSTKWLWVQFMFKTCEIDLWCKYYEIVKNYLFKEKDIVI